MEFVSNMLERGSSVIVVNRLKAGRLKNLLVRIPKKEIDFSLLQSVQTDLWTRPASDSVAKAGVKRPGREAAHSSTFSRV